MIIRRAQLQAALAATGKDNSRYYLSAVQADPSKHSVIATDGNVLLVCTDRRPEQDSEFPSIPGAEFHGEPDKPMCISVDVVQSMLKTMPKRATLPILQSCQLSQAAAGGNQNGEAGQYTVAATDLPVRNVARINPENQGQFPAWEHLMPKADRPSIVVSLGIPVLESLIKAAKAIDSKTITLTLPVERDKAGEPTGTVLTVIGVTITDTDVAVTGVAMPCRL
jgi:hypothetical protein